jgi:regulatory protein
MPIDAERWLASRGVRREPLHVGSPAQQGGEGGGDAVAIGGPPPGVREVIDHARQSATDFEHDGPVGAVPPVSGDSDVLPVDRGDDVNAAVGFIRRSTANAPQSEGRLRVKLADRGYDAATVEAALGQARDEGFVDDDAILAALIAERRTRGHADARLRRDLRDRGFSGAQVDEALERYATTDPAAAAFAVARAQAARHRGVDAEVAVRRTVGALMRRGHGEALARKAARDAVYADREAQATAGR